MKRLSSLIVLAALALQSCIPTDNPVIDTGASTGGGTPDVTQCAVLGEILDGKDYVPRSPVVFASDGRVRPDVFYLGWSKLDERNDLRFPAKGYSGDGFEDKLLVSRELEDGEIRSWQLLPMLDETCQDTEKIRIHSFDVAPDGRSLFLSMRREGDTRLAIYEFDFTSFTFRKITNDDSVHFLNPTYVGDDAETGQPILFVAKSVQASELPLNYGGPTDGDLLDEYDRDATPLIHILNAETGDLERIGLNNSHQTEPVAIDLEDGTRLVVFTQWEHQQSTNRFSLWKIQVDGSDNFTFFGQESATDRSAANIFQPREIKSGPYQGYVLMAQGRSGFVADGSIMMTRRHHLDLRSDRIALERYHDGENIARNPEHYNDESMVYAYRETKDRSYGIYIKDYPIDPASLTGDTHIGPRKEIMVHNDLHFVHPRSFYPPSQQVAATGEGTIGESRSSFTNPALMGHAGFLVQDLTQSDNGVQHQTDGMLPGELSMRFFIPSHTIRNGSQAIGKLGWSGSPELSVPASSFLSLEDDGSLGAILNPGLYVWKLYKQFHYHNSYVQIPIRAERQEISFVPDRVNACNQCHQERDQANIDKYEDVETIASVKMQGSDLSGVHDTTGYDTANAVPDFHQDVMPMFTEPSTIHPDGLACSDCHNARDKLDLSNRTGARSQSPTWLALVRGAHKLADSDDVVPYITNSINPMGFDDDYGPAPFMWALLLGDDLTEPEAPNFPDESSRSLSRPGDYGATFDQRIVDAITDINTNGYDHTQHWTANQMQAFISYSTSQSMVGLSDRIDFDSQGSGMTESAAGQKAYQAMVRQCFNCHNNHTSDGINEAGFGLPLEKRFRSLSDLKSRYLRLLIDSHVAQKDDTAFSTFLSQSNINTSMSRTLSSARDRINFDAPSESQLLVYARCSDPDPLHSNVNHPFCLPDTHEDYLALKTWVDGETAENQAPVVDSPLTPITFAEYAEPALLGPITWTDPDGDLAQLFLRGADSSEHTFNDTMLAIEYDSFNAAQVETFAILGDRGDREFEFLVSDGQTNSEIQRIPVTVTSNYIVPQPKPDLPDFQAFYTVRESGELRRIDNTGDDQLVGVISGYSPDFSTVYRRSDKGWLYFVNQAEQRLIVVDETTAQVVFNLTLNHEPNRENDKHEQTVYLIWWRPAEFDGMGNMTRPGRLEGLLESKHSQDVDGDWYIDLGDGEPPAAGGEATVVPEYLTRIPEADNAVSVYVWCRATFMTQLVANGIDRLNTLNLVTGKAKNLGDFSFEAKSYQGMEYAAKDYLNMRAILLSEDGAFYGFNQDLNTPPTLMSFDPLERVQTEVVLPDWLIAFLNDAEQYATPFVVVPPRTPGHQCPQP